MIDTALLNLLPPLRRARGDRFYGADQKHWVDLWKQDGLWLLGRRPEGAAKEWKIQLDKGLAGWLPSHWPRRLEPLIRQLLPQTTAVRLFRNADRALSFLGSEEEAAVGRLETLGRSTFPFRAGHLPGSFLAGATDRTGSGRCACVFGGLDRRTAR